MGIDLAIAFFVGLIWWEYIVLTAVIVGMGISLNTNSAIGSLVLIAVAFSIPWSGTGAVFATMTFGSFIGYAILFLGIGVIWSIYKWQLFVREKIKHYQEDNKEYTKEEVKYEINRSKSNDQIAFWIILWPFSSLGYLINDFIYDIVIAIVKKITKIYDGITDKLINSSTLKEGK